MEKKQKYTYGLLTEKAGVSTFYRSYNTLDELLEALKSDKVFQAIEKDSYTVIELPLYD